ncbi:hypothetical protein AAHB37_07820 [Glutamicibacter halophytocola]|uniref:hypothetical protein n=1 Tax=Glutamicibacter halophytocola TaxID=1933880 RepID=UPI00321A6B39
MISTRVTDFWLLAVADGVADGVSDGVADGSTGAFVANVGSGFSEGTVAESGVPDALAVGSASRKVSSTVGIGISGSSELDVL